MEKNKITQKSHSTEKVALAYQVALEKPASHLFEVTFKIENWQSTILDLIMPVWTPGSYLVREYSKQVQEFSAIETENQSHLHSEKISKNHWQINTTGVSQITVQYRVFANELTVRTNHLDQSHGYFNGAALFCFIPGYEQHPISLKILVPNPDWKIATALATVPGKTNTFLAPDFDTLVDSPFEIGIHQRYDFNVLGKSHQFVIWGQGNADVSKIIHDTQKIIEVEAKLYDGLPYEHYLFILHLSNSGFGGLEHKYCCSLNYSRFGLRSKDKYSRFTQLVAHEFFHLWNVKRIRPKALEKFDYTQENYTKSLWFSEGTTSYYDLLIPLWAGIYGENTFLENLSKEITRFLSVPGRKVQALEESSFDAWIKLYRRDSNSDNCQISYYLKGEMVSLLLDLRIRANHQHQSSLDDVMRLMWNTFGKNEVGFSDNQLRQVIESVAQENLVEFFQFYLEGTKELPFNDYLKPFGLSLNAVMEDEPTPYLGIQLAVGEHLSKVKSVFVDSPAWLAGIGAGDELLAIDGIRVKAKQLNERLKDYRAGDMMHITVFQQDELRTFPVTVTDAQPSRYEVKKIDNPSEEQQQNLQAWLTPQSL